MEGDGGHILVVDDNKINRMVLARAVKEQGHRVTTAENGRQALDLLRAEPFDVVLLDILMPEMDGYQTLDQIKQDDDLRHMPVIMISAVEEMDSVVRCIGMGATDYLPKPFNPALLQARLNASLAQKRLRDLELEYLEQVNRVVGAAQAVEAAAFDPDSLNAVAARDDALGQLARVFQRMAREVYLREQRLKHQLQQLHLDVDEMKRALAEPISVYLPMDRRQALVRGKDLPDRMSGAALFADVSGFTPLTAALAQELGLQRGVEELIRHLNRVYGALIAEVHRYGGSVVGFSGDAITCWLDDEGAAGAAPGAAPAAPAGLRAAACGLAMQDAMAEFASVITPTGSSFSLAIKVAAVAGPVRRFLIGDPQIYNIEVMAGRTLDELAQAEHQAEPGQVVVQAQIVDQAGGQVEVAGWCTDDGTGQRFAVISGLAEPVSPLPWPDLLADALTDAQCRPWLLPVVYERISGKAKQFLSELRPAVALFLSFQGIDFDGDDQAGAKLDAFARWVQTVLERYEGSLIRVTIGEKGSFLYAAFGAPLAHNDDEVRAIYSALALQSPPPDLDFITGIQIGVTQGLMRTGAYGSTTRRTYGLQGDKANLAARLMQAARSPSLGRGGILCDEAVYQAAQARLVFEALPAIKVKGKSDPIEIYRPTGEKKRFARRQAQLLGRAAERVLMRESLQHLVHGTSQIVVVEGEAGIGKSRLVAELKAQAEAMQVAALTVTGNAAEKDTPYRAWRDVLRTLCGLDDDHDREAQGQQLLALLQDRPEQRQLAPLLNPVLSLALADNEMTTSLSGQARLDRTRSLLVALLRERFQPTARAIFVENAQDLDPASWMLTLAVSQQVHPLLLVIATRPLPEPLPTGYAQLQRASQLQTLSLKALSGEETYLLACEHLGVVSVPGALVDLLQKAGGNPFVIEELVYQLRDEGYLTVVGGRCRVAPEEELRGFALPTTAQGAIISRIDRLSPSEQLVLKVASVVGRDFGRQMLHDIFPVDADKPHLDRHLQTLERLDLIARNAPQSTYTFKNLLTQETAYNSMLYVQRRQLHRLAAEWCERSFHEDLAPHYATLAHHWRQADDPAKAMHYLEKASEHAMQTGAYQDAERLLQESLELDARSAVLSTEYYE